MLVQKLNSILIYGAGSIGSLFGGLISSYPHGKIVVTLLGREPHISVIKKKGLRIRTPNHDWVTISSIKAISIISDIFKEKIDTFIVTSKVYDNELIVEEMITNKLVSKLTKLIIIQNGVGNEKIFRKLFSDSQIYRVITTEGAYLHSPGEIYHTGQGTTIIGQPYSNDFEDPFLNEFVYVLNSVGINSMLTDKINENIWLKCLINAVINPIATINNVKNGELLKQPALKNLLTELISEICYIFKQRGIKLPNDINPLDIVVQVASATSNNECSMLQDIQRGRKTEIDYFNGKIVEEAASANIESPINLDLIKQIKELEKINFLS